MNEIAVHKHEGGLTQESGHCETNTWRLFRAELDDESVSAAAAREACEARASPTGRRYCWIRAGPTLRRGPAV